MKGAVRFPHLELVRVILVFRVRQAKFAHAPTAELLQQVVRDIRHDLVVERAHAFAADLELIRFEDHIPIVFTTFAANDSLCDFLANDICDLLRLDVAPTLLDLVAHRRAVSV